MSARTEEFREVADRVWVARHEWLDLNVTAVLGDRGLLLVDTHGSERAARAMLDRLRRVSTAPLVAVLNTHAHWDHVLGNAVVTEEFPEADLMAHEAAVAGMPASRERVLDDLPRDDPDVEAVESSRLVLPGTTFSSVRALDLGDRYVELVHCGRGHTDGDVVVRVPDADVLVAGDLLEESAPPVYGVDSWPLEWPVTLELVGQMTTPDTVVVPGHGAVVDQDFLHGQRADTGIVAETIHHLAGQGVSLEDALAHEDWPFPPEAVATAVRLGYEHLPRSARRLPVL
ncbi:MBL fold metallo-hydrolase [Nocardioides marmoribigeumensis]|uniref:Glyoxylase-like metal-dependent hydrolase (Beta-lactamase superfamily II) n=1 Tax=Nocardioides marmoribigeumensis TaxID=433649 RepID=A0ABU2C0T1_9ACTN|nr:MBL fold metallo-hydrolase [Nocardioides marmoribigeumensis]MDR7364278.1 glyoxylase-like metal-dependent hydrolase (beta-lactamase superfamily II) [Nocardioides marmoribigeumensis]